MAASGFSELDDALLERVASWLPLEDLCRLARCSRRLYGVVKDAGPVWRALYVKTFTADEQQQQRQEEDRRPGSSSKPEAERSAAGSARPPGPVGGSAAATPANREAPAGCARSKRKRDGEAGAIVAVPAAAIQEPKEGWREHFKARFIEESHRQRLVRQARRLRAESALQVLQLEAHRLEQALQQEQRLLPQLEAQLAALQQARQQAATAALAEVYWQPVAVQLAHGMVTSQAPQEAEAREQDLQQRVAVSRLEVRKLAAALGAKRRRLAEARRKVQALLP